MKRGNMRWLLVLGLSSCAGHPLPPTAPPAVPLAEAQVKTAVDAQTRALRWVVQDSSAVRGLRLDELTVCERPAEWQVWIRKQAAVKPPAALIVVDKRTGQVRRQPLR